MHVDSATPSANDSTHSTLKSRDGTGKTVIFNSHGNKEGGNGTKDSLAICLAKPEENSDEDDDSEDEYPQNCYAFIALGPTGGPSGDNRGALCYGLFVVAFQFAFLSLMIASKMFRTLNNSEDVDNPNKDNAIGFSLAQTFPADATKIVRATQITAFIACLFFPDDSLTDFVEAVEGFPGRENKDTEEEKREDNIKWARFATFLRGTQGFTACLTVILLVMTSSDVIDIVLNFTAINFISNFDDVGFDLAKDGRYGKKMKNTAKYIANKPFPDCRKRKSKRPWVHYQLSIAFVAAVMFLLVGAIIRYQTSNDLWKTHMFRVQFDEESGLEALSGCYEHGSLSKDGEIDGRLWYTAIDEREDREGTMLAYCKKDRRWVFFEYNEMEQDPCNAFSVELAHSEKTNSFDISTAFEMGWLSPFNKPLDLYFIDNPDNERSESFFVCDQVANDGKCDEELNIYDYKYDGGDCCSSTCKHGDCFKNIDDLEVAFGQEISGAKGFPNCKDPETVDLTVALLRFEYNIPQWAQDSNYTELEDWKDIWEPPLLVLECDQNMVFSIPIHQSMVENSMISQVGEGATCTVTINNFEPVWEIEVLVDDTAVIVQNLIPSEIGLLTNLKVLHLFDEGLTGNIPKEIGSLTSSLVELDISQNHLDGTIPAEMGALTSLSKLVLASNDLTGSIPTQIPFLENFVHLDLGGNRMFGILPSEIGKLENLSYLDLNTNELTGDVPIEIESLKNLTFLDLSGNKLCGSVNCTKFKKMDETQQELCQSMNTFRPCITASPSVSISPSALPSESMAPSASFAPTDSQSPSALPSESFAPTDSRSPSALPEESLVSSGSQLPSGTEWRQYPWPNGLILPSSSPSEPAATEGIHSPEQTGSSSALPITLEPPRKSQAGL